MNSILSAAEAAYKHKKLANKIERASKILSIDWKLINEERESLGLPKISNETNRKAYLDLFFKEDMVEELDLELEYNTLLRDYYEEKGDKK